MSLSKSYAEHTVLLLVSAVWLWHMRMCGHDVRYCVKCGVGNRDMIVRPARPYATSRCSPIRTCKFLT